MMGEGARALKSILGRHGPSDGVSFDLQGMILQQKSFWPATVQKTSEWGTSSSAENCRDETLADTWPVTSALVFRMILVKYLSRLITCQKAILLSRREIALFR